MDKICKVVFDPREHVYHCFCKYECGCAVVLWLIFSTKKLQEYAQHSLYQSVCGRLGVDQVWRIDIDSRANGSPHAQTSMDPYSQNGEKKTTENLNFSKSTTAINNRPTIQMLIILTIITIAILSILSILTITIITILTILRAKREASRNSSSQHVVNINLPRMDSSHSGVLARRVLRISHQLQVRKRSNQLKNLQ